MANHSPSSCSNEVSTLDKTISSFIYETCAINPQPNGFACFGLTEQYFLGLHLAWEGMKPTDVTRTTSGSSSEFYIEPMPPSVNDIDIMIYNNCQLVVPPNHRMPKYIRLPEEFQCRDEINVFEWKASQFPGYVFASKTGKLIKVRSTDDRFEFLPKASTDRREEQPMRLIFRSNRSQPHGPAFMNDDVMELIMGANRCLSADYVMSVRCLEWPPEAGQWAERRRKFNWPAAATVRSVVGNGCEIVHVAHRRCRLDESMHEGAHVEIVVFQSGDNVAEQLDADTADRVSFVEVLRERRRINREIDR